MTRRGPGRWECIGVHRCGRRLTDAQAHWCQYCHGGAYCLEALEGHEAAHRELEEEKKRKEAGEWRSA